jgi:hypothetical protein
MPNLNEILQQIQRDLYCPICGRNYESGDIKIKGLFQDTLILQTLCANGHLTLFMTTFTAKEKKKPINNDDVLDLKNALLNFNGDFQNLWKN